MRMKAKRLEPRLRFHVWIGHKLRSLAATALCSLIRSYRFSKRYLKKFIREHRYRIVNTYTHSVIRKPDPLNLYSKYYQKRFKK